MKKRVSSMPIDINVIKPRSALLRGIRITEFEGHIINPDPIILKETDLLLEEFLSPTKLKALTGSEDLNSVEFLEMIVDTSETSLGNFGIYLPNLTQLKLNGSNVPRIRDLGTSLAHLTVLWLSRSCLVDLDGLATLNNLKELYLAYNDITDISPCSLLEKIVCLDLEGNLIDDLKQIEFLNLCTSLSNLTLYGNPICSNFCESNIEKNFEFKYRNEIIKILPSLKTLDDEPIFNTKTKSKTKDINGLCLKNVSCPFDDDWQLINQLLDEGIGPDEEKLAINESVRPGTSSSSSYGSRKTTGVRPFTSMRPLSSYRFKTSDQTRRNSSGYSFNSSFSSHISSSPTQPLTPNNENLICDPENSEASFLTVGPTFQGNPLKSLLARKKNNLTQFTIQTKQNCNKLANSEKNNIFASKKAYKKKEGTLENKLLRSELEDWRNEHARRIQERKSYFEPQVLVIDDALSSNQDFEDDGVIISQETKSKSTFKSSFENNTTKSSNQDEKQNLETCGSKSKLEKTEQHSKSHTKNLNETNNHQPKIVSNSSQTSNSQSMAILKTLKPSLLSNSPNLIAFKQSKQLKTNIAPLPEINFQK